ncbi:hypothetical protein [Asaia prunellae]|uniref:hypothetical protein n=1 Tax=Asaia prunellae TaxID=610245 RepID=UPI000688FC1B|nr:hypothetical protein [Asaia prunellae]
MVALAVGIGGGLSNLIGGYIVQYEGYRVGFLSLTVVAALAFLFFLGFMPETREPITTPRPPCNRARDRMS